MAKFRLYWTFMSWYFLFLITNEDWKTIGLYFFLFSDFFTLFWRRAKVAPLGPFSLRALFDHSALKNLNVVRFLWKFEKACKELCPNSIHLRRGFVYFSIVSPSRFCLPKGTIQLKMYRILSHPFVGYFDPSQCNYQLFKIKKEAKNGIFYEECLLTNDIYVYFAKFQIYGEPVRFSALWPLLRPSHPPQRFSTPKGPLFLSNAAWNTLNRISVMERTRLRCFIKD